MQEIFQQSEFEAYQTIDDNNFLTHRRRMKQLLADSIYSRCWFAGIWTEGRNRNDSGNELNSLSFTKIPQFERHDKVIDNNGDGDIAFPVAILGMVASTTCESLIPRVEIILL